MEVKDVVADVNGLKLLKEKIQKLIEQLDYAERQLGVIRMEMLALIDIVPQFCSMIAIYEKN